MVGHSSERGGSVELIENDDLFDALADGRRRRLLVDLVESDPQQVPNLSEASRELSEAHETLLDQYLSGQVEISGVDRELFQQHRVDLPKLVEYGFVEWCPEENLVRRGPRFDKVQAVLEQIVDGRTDSAGTVSFDSFPE